jgi:hypothetical protein
MASRKNSLRIVLGTLAVALLSLLAFWAFWAVTRWSQPEDPLYAGTPLSVHLYSLYAPQPRLRGPLLTASNTPSARAIAAWRADGLKRNAARQVLSSVRPGREALPLLTHWLATKPLPWKLKLGERLRSYNADYLNLSVDRRAVAINFLFEFPLGAANELRPHLEAAISSTNDIELLQIGSAFIRNLNGATDIAVEDALRVLMAFKYRFQGESPFGVPNFRPFTLFEIDGAILRLDPQRIFLPLYVLEFGPVPERVGAAMELAAFPRLPDRAVPLLLNNLSSTNRSVQEQCAKALSQYGGQARIALPALTNLLSHSKPRVQIAASNAIAAILSTRSSAPQNPIISSPAAP